MSFEGEIGEIDLIQRLVELGGEHFTGAIRFESDGIIKIVYFKGGDVLSASTNDRTDSIDEILLRAGKVTREHIKQALAKRKESETLGDALLGLGFITRKELTWARRVQVIGILRSIIGWANGSYTIVSDYLPKREEGTLFPLQQILVELIVTDTDRPKYEQAMASGSAVFERSANFDEEFRRLGLNEDAEQIVAHVDGSSTAAEVASRSGKDIFNVYKLLEALRALGLLRRTTEAKVTPEVYVDDFAAVGAVDAADSWSVENPDFTLDDNTAADQPTLEIPPMNFDSEPVADEVIPSSPPPHDDDDAFSATQLISPSPVEDLAAPPPIAPPGPRPAEPQWGFDEAQIETARRAAVPVRSAEGKITTPPATDRAQPEKPRRGLGFVLIPLILLLVAAAAFAGWRWWAGQSAPAPQPVASARRIAPPVTPVAAAAPAPVTQTQTTPSTTATTAATATTASSPQPATTSSSSTADAVPLPRVIARKTPSAPTAARPAAATPASPRLERTTAGATITNTAAQSSTPAEGGAVRTKYEAMARDFAAKPSGAYTVQFELVCETASITRAMREGGSDVWFVPTRYHSRSCYRVFWGHYPTSAEASAASRKLPASLGATPVVVKIPR